MPIYRENPLIIKFSMLCPGISQNTKLHHLTLYKGQVWEETPYTELCNHNVLNIVYSWTANNDYPIEQNGELHVPPVPSKELFVKGDTMVAWDSEILESFAELTDITDITFHYNDNYEDSFNDSVLLIITSSVFLLSDIFPGIYGLRKVSKYKYLEIFKI